MIVFFLSLAVLCLLFMVMSGIRAVQEGFSLSIIMPWVISSIGYSLFYTVPISLLFASTLCYGRVVADREYTALCSMGFSPLHLFVPMALLSGLLGATALFLHGTAFADAHYAQRNIARYLIKQLDNLGDSKQRRMPIDGGSVWYDVCRDGTQLYGVVIEKMVRDFQVNDQVGEQLAQDADEAEQDERKRKVQLLAERARIDVDGEKGVVHFTLENMTLHIASPEDGYWDNDPNRPKAWDEITYTDPFTVSFPINEKKRRRGDLSNSELAVQNEQLEQLIAEQRKLAASSELPPAVRQEAEVAVGNLQIGINKNQAEVWRRRALALAFFTFPFLGFPISVSLRHRHRLVSFFSGTMMVVGIFYPLLLLGETLAEKYGLPAPLMMLSGNMVLAGVAFFFTGRLFFR